jgi:hypothetical protein
MATQTPNTYKWTGNADIDKELSNEFWKTWKSHINKNHASSNSEPELIWVMLENNCSLVGKHIPLLRAPFAIHTNRTHGYMYYLPVNNNTYIHFTSKDTTKQYGKLGNY